MEYGIEKNDSATLLKRLEQLAAVSQSNVDVALTQGQETGHDPAIVLPEGVRVESLGHLLPAPLARRGTFTTTMLAAFLSYCEDYVKPLRTEVFVSPEKRAAKAVFDQGDADDPGWGSHTGELFLKRTASYDALLKSDRVPMAQEKFVEWVEDNEDALVFSGRDGTEMPTPLAIRALRELTVQQAKVSTSSFENLSSSTSAMESVELSSALEMPHGFRFITAPYLSLEIRNVEAVLKARQVGETAVSLSYRIKSLELLEEDVANEFADLLSEATELEEATVYLGSYS